MLNGCACLCCSCSVLVVAYCVVYGCGVFGVGIVVVCGGFWENVSFGGCVAVVWLCVVFVVLLGVPPCVLAVKYGLFVVA